MNSYIGFLVFLLGSHHVCLSVVDPFPHRRLLVEAQPQLLRPMLLLPAALARNQQQLLGEAPAAI